MAARKEREGREGSGRTSWGALRVLLRPRLQVRDQRSMLQMDKWLEKAGSRAFPEGRRGFRAEDAEGGDGKGGRGGEGMRMRM